MSLTDFICKSSIASLYPPENKLTKSHTIIIPQENRFISVDSNQLTLAASSFLHYYYSYCTSISRFVLNYTTIIARTNYYENAAISRGENDVSRKSSVYTTDQSGFEDKSCWRTSSVSSRVVSSRELYYYLLCKKPPDHRLFHTECNMFQE